MTDGLSRTFRALRYRNFRLFFIGQGLSVMGTWLQQVAMGWLTYRLTGSVWLLGVVAFCGSAGIVAFGTFAGVVADHVHRRRALRITQSLALLQALTLAVLTWSGHIAVWHLIVLALWLGVVSAFDVPLRQSALGAPRRGPRRPAERDRAQLVPRQRGARDRSRASRDCCSPSSAKPCASRSTRCPSSR